MWFTVISAPNQLGPKANLTLTLTLMSSLVVSCGRVDLGVSWLPPTGVVATAISTVSYINTCLVCNPNPSPSSWCLFVGVDRIISWLCGWVVLTMSHGRLYRWYAVADGQWTQTPGHSHGVLTALRMFTHFFVSVIYSDKWHKMTTKAWVAIR